MEMVDRAFRDVLVLLSQAVDFFVAILVQLEIWLRSPLNTLGIPPKIQAIIMIFGAVALLVAVLKLFGGVVRVLLVAFLVCLAIHLLSVQLRL